MVTSRSFSRHPLLKKELLDIFPNSIFNPNGMLIDRSHIIDFLSDADGVILGLEKIDKSIFTVYYIHLYENLNVLN